MTDQKKITRREAIKILGATAGASLLANIPTKWSTPELTGGALPAHAQTSTSFSILCADNVFLGDSSGPLAFSTNPVTSNVSISPATDGVLLNFSVAISNATLNTASSGQVSTSGGGQASTDIDHSTPSNSGYVDVTWSLASDASVFCVQRIQWQRPGAS